MKKQKKLIKTNYTGSEKTAPKVKEQIAEKFGKIEANKYDPNQNCRTFKSWIKNGFQVKRGEKSLKSFIIVNYKDKKGFEIKRAKPINLFYYLQVKAIKK